MTKVLIKNIGKVITGNTPSKTNSEFYESEDIGFVKPDIIADSEISSINSTNEYISEKARNKARIVEKNTVFITCIGSIGKVGIAEGSEYAFNQQINAIKVNEKVISKYLAYNLLSSKNRLVSMANAPVVPIINKTQFENFEIFIDENIDNQKKIVDILDKANQIILLKKSQLKELDNLIKSRFVEMFGDLAVNPFNWKESQLIDLCSHKDDIKCGPFGTQLSKDEYKKDGVPLWGIPQINSFFTIMPTDYLSEEKAKLLEAYSIINGDIVMSRKGNVGKCAIYPDDLPIGIMHSDALRIRINPEEMNSNFLMHQLHNSRYVVNQIKNVSSGAIMAGVNVTKLKTISVHIPPINLQNEFETFVQQIDKLKVEVRLNILSVLGNYQLINRCNYQ